MIQMAKGFGTILLSLAVLVVLVALSGGLIWGSAWISDRLIGPAIVVSQWALTICVIVLLPLSFFRLTRVVSMFGLLACSYIFGVTAWMAGLLATMYYWGFWMVVIGVFLGGVGVLPIGILAAIIHADWPAAGMLVAGAALTYGSRAMALWLASVQDRANERQAAKRFTRQAKTVGEVAPVFD
jgi:hypothetical protein